MEVHTHTHTARKKWTHYFWEFLMLFFAVFCGFLAEYQLEHMIERDREKDYMRGMLADLYEDTANINQAYNLAQAVSKGIDSLKQNLYNTDFIKENTYSSYRQYGTYLRRFAVRFSDQTAAQLLNSGQMRLIRKRNVVKEMTAYWRRSSRIGYIEERLEIIMNEIASFSDGIINKNYLGEYGERDSLTSIGVIEVLPAAVLMTHDKNKLISFENKLERLKISMYNFYLCNVSSQKKAAVNLIDLIKNEYHLK